MKRNSSARSAVKTITGCLAIAVLVVFEVAAGKSLVSRIDQVTTVRTDMPQVPSMDISDFMAVR
jgi:hypothetical protein